MSTSAIRTTAKVQSLRPPEKMNDRPTGMNNRSNGSASDSGSPAHRGSSSGGGFLARAVALHLAGKRDEALEQLRRAIAANEANPEIYRAMGHIQFELNDYAESAKSYRS